MSRKSKSDEQYQIVLNWDGESSLRGFNLAARDLSGMDFQGIDLMNADLRQSNLALYKRSCHQTPQVNFPEQDSCVLSGSSNPG